MQSSKIALTFLSSQRGKDTRTVCSFLCLLSAAAPQGRKGRGWKFPEIRRNRRERRFYGKWREEGTKWDDLQFSFSALLCKLSTAFLSARTLFCYKAGRDGNNQSATGARVHRGPGETVVFGDGTQWLYGIIQDRASWRLLFTERTARNYRGIGCRNICGADALQLPYSFRGSQWLASVRQRSAL